MDATTPTTVRFGSFEANLVRRELRQNGKLVKLQDQPFEVLAALLHTPGEIVTKEELRERIWNEDTFVDFDRSLATAVNKVRQALGDSATRPHYIETVPRKGYRFIGTVVRDEPVGSAATSSAAHLPPAPVGRRARFVWIAGAVFGLLVAATLGWHLSRSRNRPERPVSFATPLTTYPGFESAPDVSPDGSQVAFMWQAEGEQDYDIFVRAIGAGDPVALTNTPENEYHPQWSPDGQWVVFARFTADGQLILVRAPALGGQEVTLTTLTPSGRQLETAMRRLNRIFTWTPDGEGLVVCLQDEPDGTGTLYSYAFRSGTLTPLRRAQRPRGYFANPSFDRAGVLSYTETSRDDGQSRFYLWDLGDTQSPAGEPALVHTESHAIAGSVLSPLGDELVFSARAPLPSLWAVPLSPPGPARRVPGAAERAVSPAFSLDGRLLVHGTWASHYDVWRVELTEPGVAAGPATPWLQSTYDDTWPDVTRDGTRVAFQSTRGGSHQIWVADADGKRAVRLTNIDSSLTGSPAWSPDGSMIAFDSLVGSEFAVFVMNANGSGIRRLSEPGLRAFRPQWSADGQWIYYGTSDGQTVRTPVEGGATEVMVERLGGGRLGANEEFVYGTRRRPEGGFVWRINIDSKAEEQVLDEPVHTAVAGLGGVYFVRPGPDLVPAPILFYRLSDRRILEVTTPPLSRPARLRPTPDGKYLSFSQAQDVGGDLMVIRDYR